MAEYIFSTVVLMSWLLVLTVLLGYLQVRHYAKQVIEDIRIREITCMQSMKTVHRSYARSILHMDSKIMRQKRLELLRLKKKVRRASRKNKRKRK